MKYVGLYKGWSEQFTDLTRVALYFSVFYYSDYFKSSLIWNCWLDDNAFLLEKIAMLNEINDWKIAWIMALFADFLKWDW